jgi:hypothetical protein
MPSFKLFKTKKNKPNILRRKGATAVVKELSQYVFVSESRNYKVNFTIGFLLLKALKNSRVFDIELQILFPDGHEEFHTIQIKIQSQLQVFSFFLKISVFVG